MLCWTRGDEVPGHQKQGLILLNAIHDFFCKPRTGSNPAEINWIERVIPKVTLPSHFLLKKLVNSRTDGKTFVTEILLY